MIYIQDRNEIRLKGWNEGELYRKISLIVNPWMDKIFFLYEPIFIYYTFQLFVYSAKQ